MSLEGAAASYNLINCSMEFIVTPTHTKLQALKLFEGQEDEIGRELQELDEQLIITPTLDTDLKRKVVHPKWGEAIVRGEFGRVRKRFIASRL